MAEGYKTDKEAFVSGMTGSSIMHVILVSLVALVCPPNLYISSSIWLLLKTGLCFSLRSNPNATSTNSRPWCSLILEASRSTFALKHDFVRTSTVNFPGSALSAYWITALFSKT